MDNIIKVLTYNEWLESNKKDCPRTTVRGRKYFDQWKQQKEKWVIATTMRVTHSREVLDPSDVLAFTEATKRYIEEVKPTHMMFGQYEHTIEFHSKLVDDSLGRVDEYLQECYAKYVDDTFRSFKDCFKHNQQEGAAQLDPNNWKPLTNTDA